MGNEKVHLAPFKLLPPKEGTCPICATKHDPTLPHNQLSLYYQYRFYDEHGRWATWKDAMEHCTDEVKELWTIALKEKGISIE